MSQYTTEVRFICEKAACLNGSQGYNSINEIIAKAIPNVFNFDFPIFDESYRDVLCGKILKHYYTREICEETVGLWKLRMDTKLNEIMPYYNKLYNSELLEFNPLYDIDLTTENAGHKNDVSSKTGKEDNKRNESRDVGKTTSLTSQITDGETIETEGTDNNTITDTGNVKDTISRSKDSTDKYSDTPQGALTGVISGEYLTNARLVEDTDNSEQNTTNENSSVRNSSNSSKQERNLNGNRTDAGSESTVDTGEYTFSGTSEENTTITSTDGYVQHVRGKTGGASYGKLITEFRNSLLNIDMLIINELEPLFFGLW